jgi:hypothetical protein
MELLLFDSEQQIAVADNDHRFILPNLRLFSTAAWMTECRKE